MTRAKAQRVEPDRIAAAALIAQARAHLESARIDGIDAQSAYGIAYQAALKAMVAGLLADGLRVTSGAGGHIVTIEQAELELGGAIADADAVVAAAAEAVDLT